MKTIDGENWFQLTDIFPRLIFWCVDIMFDMSIRQWMMDVSCPSSDGIYCDALFGSHVDRNQTHFLAYRYTIRRLLVCA